MKFSSLLKRSSFILLLFISSTLYAASPTATVQGVANRMVAALEKNQSQLKSNPSIIHGIVDRVLLPYVDVNRMAGMVVGRNNWYSATPDERRRFVELFKNSVVSTYSNALSSYDDDRVEVFPLRGDAAGRRSVQVNSQILRKGGQKIAISYNLVRKNGQWKVYDFSIEGVSIIANFRSQYANALAQGGLKALNARLGRHNERAQ